MRASITWTESDWCSSFVIDMAPRTLIRYEGDTYVYKIEATGKVALISKQTMLVADIYDDISDDCARSTAYSFVCLKLGKSAGSYSDSNGNSWTAPKRAFKDGVLNKATLTQVIGWLEGEIEPYLIQRNTIVFSK